MSAQGQQVVILKEGTERSTGRDARSSNIMAARIVSEAVKTSLGPKGMDKMLVDSFGDVTITNDGATMLKEMDVQHPAAKMMVEVSKTQDDEVGDGTTSVVVLTGGSAVHKRSIAEVVAHESRRRLLMVDRAQLASKYIGETEKNLDRAFERAEQLDGIRFFDEADALFGRRAAGEEARHRYANQETPYLLQRIDARAVGAAHQP